AISSTFSAFFSPLRERLNEPTNVVSSQTQIFACMKSCTVPSPYGVEFLPVNGPDITCSSNGSFHEMFWFTLHCCTTSRTCVASTHPAMSTDLSAITCASVPSTGPVVITGEQM